MTYFKQVHFFLHIGSKLIQGELFMNWEELYKTRPGVFQDIINHRVPTTQK